MSSFVFQTKALKENRAIAVATAAATSTILTGVIIGIFFLGESLPSSGSKTALRLFSWGLLIFGVACLTNPTSTPQNSAGTEKSLFCLVPSQRSHCPSFHARPLVLMFSVSVCKCLAQSHLIQSAMATNNHCVPPEPTLQTVAWCQIHPIFSSLGPSTPMHHPGSRKYETTMCMCIDALKGPELASPSHLELVSDGLGRSQHHLCHLFYLLFCNAKKKSE